MDSLCSGRAARRERWAFTRVQSCNEVFVDEQRLLLDSLLLNPADGPLDGPHRLGHFNCLALVLIVGGPLREASTRVLESVAAQPVKRGVSLICSASPIRDGVILRLAGEQVEEVALEVQRQLGFLEDVFEDNREEGHEVERRHTANHCDTRGHSGRQVADRGGLVARATHFSNTFSGECPTRN